MNRAAQILVKQLQHYGHGDALWNPSPSDGEGLEIGDVGFIDTRGSFERCFNAAQNADGNLNKNRVPAGFNPVKITALHRKHGEQYSPTFLTGRSIKKTKVNIHANAAAAGVADAGARYQVSRSTKYAAWIELKDHAETTYLLPPSYLKEYILKNHGSWCNFVTSGYEDDSGLGLECQHQNIIFVTGFVKTSAWAVTAYSRGGYSSHSMTLAGGVGGAGELGLDVDIERSEGDTFYTHAGPKGRDSLSTRTSSDFPRRSISSGTQPNEAGLSTPPSVTRDQSVFVSYYKVVRRKFLPDKIVASAGPHQLPRGPDGDGDAGVLSDPDTSVEEVPQLEDSQHLPIDDLLDYIFENSDAQVAIANHSDLVNLFYGKLWPDDVAEWLRLNQPEVIVDEEKFGYISSHDSIIQQRTHALLEAVAQQDQVEQEEHLKHAAILDAEQGGYQPLAAAPTQDDTNTLDEAPSTEKSPTETMPQLMEEDVPEKKTETTALPNTADKMITKEETQLSTKLYDRSTGAESVTEGRPYGSSVKLDGKVYLGNGKQNRYITYPHMVLTDRSASGCGITCLTVSVSTNRVATTCEDCTIRVWDIVSGALLMKLDEHQEASITAIFSPDGTKLVSGGKDHKGILWDLNRHTQIAYLEGHTDRLQVVDYSPNGKLIATGSVDCKVKVWDGVDGKALFTIPEDHPAAVMGVHFSPDSQQILTCAENIAFLWSARDGSAIARLEGHVGLIWSARYSADGTRIVTGSEDNTARIWNAEDGTELVMLADNEGPVWAASFSPDGEDVVLGTNDGRVMVHNSWSGDAKYSFEDDHPSIVSSVEYSSDGEMIVAGYVDGSAKLWSATNGQFVAELLGNNDKCKGAMFSPDDEHVILGSDDSTIRIWNVVDLLRL